MCFLERQKSQKYFFRTQPDFGVLRHICMTLYNVGPTSKTLGRRCINVIGLQAFCVCWAEKLSLKHCTFLQCWFKAGPASHTLAYH